MALLNILTVCTGNVCRSPLVELMLEHRLLDRPVRVSSAGTRARDGMKMTAQAIDQAVGDGILQRRASAHRARYLRESHLQVDLILAMTREHRREVVEMDPALVRKTFTLRELSRLTSALDEVVLRRVAVDAGSKPSDRLSAILAYVASTRGVTLPVSTESDDVVDPYGRSGATYDLSTRQISTALPATELLIALAIDENDGGRKFPPLIKPR